MIAARGKMKSPTDAAIALLAAAGDANGLTPKLQELKAQEDRAAERLREASAAAQQLAEMNNAAKWLAQAKAQAAGLDERAKTIISDAEEQARETTARAAHEAATKRAEIANSFAELGDRTAAVEAREAEVTQREQDAKALMAKAYDAQVDAEKLEAKFNRKLAQIREIANEG